MILRYFSARFLAVFTVCAILILSFFGSTIAHSSTGWSTNTSSVASGSLACSFSPPKIVSADNGDTLAITGSGSSTCSVNVLRSSNGSNSWSLPIVLATATQIRDYSLTRLNDGTIFAMWQENTGASNATIIRQSHSRDNGLTWSSPNTISTAGNSPFDSRFPVATAYGTSGVAITWNQSDGTNTRAMVRSSPDLAQWTQSRAVSASGQNAVTSVIATNSSGGIVVAWQDIDLNGKLSVIAAGSSNWSNYWFFGTNPLTESPSQNLTTLADGSIALTFFDAIVSDGSVHRIQFHVTPDAASSWTTQGTIGGLLTSQVSGLSVTKTQDNSIVAAWGAGTTGQAIIQTSKADPSLSSWSSPTTVTPQESLPYVFGGIAANTDGSVMMIFWRIAIGSPNPIFTSYSSNNGASWGTPSQLASYVMGYPSQSLTISPLIASGYGVGWIDQANSTNTQYVRTFNWSAPVTPPAPAPSLPATGISPLNWMLLLGGTAAVGLGTVFIKSKKMSKKAHRNL